MPPLCYEPCLKLEGIAYASFSITGLPITHSPFVCLLTCYQETKILRLGKCLQKGSLRHAGTKRHG